MLQVECATRSSSACAWFGMCFLEYDVEEQIESNLKVCGITVMSKEIKLLDFWATFNPVHCLSGVS